ncbi:MAG: AAA family ATPase [Gaiellaceae bacterium]
MSQPGAELTNAGAIDNGASVGDQAMSEDDAALLERLLFELRATIVGQNRMLERVLVCLLAGGHCLIEGVPGLAKTLTIETLARSIGGSFSRIQMTPDLVPSDLVGTRIYRGSTESFDVELGPVLANIVLTDEINRAPAKVQSALLEVMAERQVSIGGTTHPAPDPFLVLATQNPIESEGVYQLPEAQRDRFLMRVIVDYPDASEEAEIVRRMGTEPPATRQVLTLEEIKGLQKRARSVYVDHQVLEYAISLVIATRRPVDYGLPELDGLLAYGASPRASLGLVAAGRALALLRGRRYVVPQDVFDVGYEVLNHRLVLSYDALADDRSAGELAAEVLARVPAPRVTTSELHDRAEVA